jgi:glucosyl-dolichyl phosphate glucuronosyltransferase
MRDTKFSVIICTRDRVGFLRDTIMAVDERLKNFPNARIVVVYGTSADGTGEYLTKLALENGRITAFYEATPGLYYARVVGLAQTAGDDFVIFIDDDVLPGDNWPDGLLAELLEKPDIGVVGTAIDPKWEGARPAWMTDRFARDIPIFSIPSGSLSYRFPCYPPGVCLALRVRDFLQLYAGPERRKMGLGLGTQGLMKKNAGLGGDDWDLSELFVRNGYRIVSIDHVRVWHRVISEKLTPIWLLKKFECDGRLRVGYARLAGYPMLSWRLTVLLTIFPALFLSDVAIRHLGLDGPRSLTLQAYAWRARGAWKELLWGIRGVRFPFTLSETNSTDNTTGQHP